MILRNSYKNDVLNIIKNTRSSLWKPPYGGFIHQIRQEARMQPIKKALLDKNRVL